MVKITELNSNKQTGEEMYSLVNRFSSDLDYFTLNGIPFSQIPFDNYFNFVKSIPFNADDYGVEIVTRPLHLLSTPWKGLDCKKKSILIASWLNENKIPFKFTAVSKRPDQEIHHVIVEAKPGNDWIEIDATYPKNYLGMMQTWTKKEKLPIERPYNLTNSSKLISMYGIGIPSKYLVYEFIDTQKKINPQSMGSAAVVIGVISAIVTAISGLTASIIGSVSAKRRQNRQMEHDIAMVEAQQGILATQAQQAVTENLESNGIDFQKLLIPAAIAAGIIFLI